MSIPKSHYFEARPATPSRPRTVRLRLGELDLELQADRGVFGSKGIDLGTMILLREAPLAAASRRPPRPRQRLRSDRARPRPPRPDARIWAVDVNERALELTRANAATALTPNVSAMPPEQVPGELRFDAIYSNPPVRVGKGPLHELLLTWLPRLKPGGAAYLVVQRNLGSDSLAKWLAEQGFAGGQAEVEEGLPGARGQGWPLRPHPGVRRDFTQNGEDLSSVP